MKIVSTLIIILCFFSFANGEEVKEIIIENNDRVSSETVKAFSGVKINQDLNENDLNNILKKLYETTFFSDVKVSLNNNKLIIYVVENKIIQRIIINGIKAKKIEEAILDASKLKDKSPYNEFIAQQDLNLIKNSLNSLGYYFADIKSYISENNNNTINLIYDIELGDKALIGKIEFTGDKKFKDRKLRNLITTEESKFWKFISNKKYLNERQILLDERLLKNFYLNNGFYNVKINSVFAQLLDTGEFKLSFNIDSGDIYTIKNTNLIIPPDYKKENFKEVQKKLKKLQNNKYSFNKISRVVEEIDKVSLTKQYEFINATIDEEIIDEKFINLTFEIVESKKLYVERVNILGNNITEEKVIRGQIITDEGDPFNPLLQTKSINNLRSLNIFKSVKGETKKGTSESQRIIDITVEEKPTGEISLGAGVGTDGNSIGFAVSENNYLGKAIKLQSSLRLTQDTIRGLFSVTNPDWRSSGRSLSTSIQATEIDKLSDSGYKTNKTGFSLGTKFEQYEDIFLSPRFSLSTEKLETNNSASSNLKKQEGNYSDLNFSYAVDYDMRNQKFMATDGFKSTFFQKLPVISDSYTIINGYEFIKYYKLPNDMVTRFSIYGRAANALQSDKDVRVSDRIRLPSKKLKGFQTTKVGPVDNGDYVGGNYSTSLNFSTTLPMFLSGVETADVAYFIDAANVWGVDYSSQIDETNKYRTSTGLSINWFTPIGPLSFSIAHPISKASTDKTQEFQFNLGTTF